MADLGDGDGGGGVRGGAYDGEAGGGDEGEGGQQRADLHGGAFLRWAGLFSGAAVQVVQARSCPRDRAVHQRHERVTVCAHCDTVGF
ncbi:hypothetical protein GCM10010236_60830 [Streptomyces eurythermus]|nr:hypothetical protein GCM10010236_60830 [Streptomyces eurythermus]